MFISFTWAHGARGAETRGLHAPCTLSPLATVQLTVWTLMHLCHVVEIVIVP